MAETRVRRNVGSWVPCCWRAETTTTKKVPPNIFSPLTIASSPASNLKKTFLSGIHAWNIAFPECYGYRPRGSFVVNAPLLSIIVVFKQICNMIFHGLSAIARRDWFQTNRTCICPGAVDLRTEKEWKVFPLAIVTGVQGRNGIMCDVCLKTKEIQRRLTLTHTLHKIKKKYNHSPLPPKYEI